MRKLAVLLLALVSAVAAFVVAWLRDRRTGSRFMNVVVNPLLAGRGLVGGGRSEVGYIEHVGRRSGVRRLSPIYPMPTGDGFRIIMPLGSESQWARNVVAAGHCRLQLHETVYELDEPVIIEPAEVHELPSFARSLFGRLGFRFLLLHRFSERPGALEPVEAEVLAAPAVAPELKEVEPTGAEGEATEATAPA